MKFITENMYQILTILFSKLKTQKNETLEFEVIDPDLSKDQFNGEKFILNNFEYTTRSYKTWIDLAEILDCRFLTPEKVKDSDFIKIRLKPLNKDLSWHKTDNKTESISEKYGIKSDFFRLNKLEEPYFIKDYYLSLKRIGIKKNDKILNLGINRGDEFIPFKDATEKEVYDSLRFTGIDHSQTAIDFAKEYFVKDSTEKFRFISADINKLSEIENLGKFNHIISVGTLQSPKIDSKNIFRDFVKTYLEKQNIIGKQESNSIILGFPNCRYIDGELKYGAKTKNFKDPEFSLLIKDIIFYKRYLQQHKFKVTITGKYYIFLVATR